MCVVGTNIDILMIQIILSVGMKQSQFPESKKVVSRIITSWEVTVVPKTHWNYGLRDIYNAGEFGLSHKALPSEKLHIEG